MAGDGTNSFEVVSVFGGAGAEAVVSGFVRSGTIRTGDLASFVDSDGVPLIASITRIATGGAEVNVVREGQKTNLTIEVDSHALHVGAVLTTPDSSGSYAPTMVASELSAAISDRPPAISKELVEIGLLVNHQKYDEAHSKLLEYASSNDAEPIEVDRLFARICLEAPGDLADAAKGLEYIKSAYGKGGHENADVLETLAYAHGANGNAAQGLRFLEQLFFHARDLGAREYYQKHVEVFRMRHRIPDAWQVIDQMGEVVFTAASIEALEKARAAKAFPENSKCRKNRIGKIVPVAEAIRQERPASGFDLLRLPRHTQLDIATGWLVGLTAGILLGALSGVSVLWSAIGVSLAGAAGGYGINRLRTRG